MVVVRSYTTVVISIDTIAKNKTKLRSLKKRSGIMGKKIPERLNIYFEMPYIWQLLNCMARLLVTGRE